jgi:hypothetical protein
MATTNDEARRAQLKPISETYFAALAERDVSSVPWHENIVLRSPLAPEGLNVPLQFKSRLQPFSGSSLCTRSSARAAWRSIISTRT